jgi:hypothetical protein
MTEEYVVSLIMEGHNTAPTKIGVLGEKGLYHSEKWIRKETHVNKIEKTPDGRIMERGTRPPFHLKRDLSSETTFQHDDQGVW